MSNSTCRVKMRMSIAVLCFVCAKGEEMVPFAQRVVSTTGNI